MNKVRIKHVLVMDFDYLTDGEINLRIHEKIPANAEKVCCLFV